MSAHPSAEITPKKPSLLARSAVSIFHLLRLFWLTLLVLLIVLIYGLRAGWSTPRQWSDGLFIAAVIQIVIGAISAMGSSSTMALSDSATARYVIGADVHETRLQVMRDYARKATFGLRAFAGALFITLLAALALLF